MDNYDSDFSTLKRPDLSAWKPDVPLGDADATLKSRPQLFDSNFDDDFEIDDDVQFNTVKASKPQKSHSRTSSDLSFFSDSTKSPSRASVNSVSSIATSWDLDEDFKIDNEELNLMAKFKQRQERAERESAREAAALAAEFQKTLSKKQHQNKFASFEHSDDNELLDVDMEQLTLKMKSGTVNKNIKITNSPMKGQQQHTRLLKGMRSIAQLPNNRQQSGGSVPQPKIRTAISMFDFGANKQPVRPLTAYKEPIKQPETRRKKITTIRQPTTVQLQRTEKDGMVFNPQTMMWEGNEYDMSRFDSFEEQKPQVRPQLITKEQLPKDALGNGMHFDKRTLSWVFANEEEYDDPFEGIEESTPVRRQVRQFTNDSQGSTISRGSVARSETSSREVFDVPYKMVSDWKHADERFMRKFGKWIGGEEESADALNADQQFYDMVRHA